MSSYTDYQTKRTDPGKHYIGDWSLLYNNLLTAIGGTGVYYADYTESNHSATGSGRTVFAILDGLSADTDPVTVVLPHNEGTTNTDYHFTGTKDFSAYTNVQFIIQPGARLDAATAITVTLPSPAHLWAPPQKIFNTAGTGKITFSDPGIVFPEWWGAAADDSTDNVSAFRAACDVGNSLVCQPGTYAFTIGAGSGSPATNDTMIELATGSSIHGNQTKPTIFKWGRADAPYWPLIFSNGVDDILIENLHLEYTGDIVSDDTDNNKENLGVNAESFCTHMFFYDCNRVIVRDCYSYGSSKDGSEIINSICDARSGSGYVFENLRIEDHGGGLMLGGCTEVTIDGITTDRQSTASNIIMGPGHSVYSFADNITIRNVKDLGSYVVEGANTIDDLGHTLSIKGAAAAYTYDVNVENVISRNPVGILTVAEVEESNFSNFHWTFPTATAVDDTQTTAAIYVQTGTNVCRYLHFADITLNMPSDDRRSWYSRMNSSIVDGLKIIWDVPNAAAKYAMTIRGNNNDYNCSVQNLGSENLLLLTDDAAQAQNNHININLKAEKTDTAINMTAAATQNNIIYCNGYPWQNSQGYDLAVTQANFDAAINKYSTPLLNETWSHMHFEDYSADTAVSHDFVVPRDACYMMAIMVQVTGGDHADISYWVVACDDRTTNDFTSAVSFGDTTDPSVLLRNAKGTVTLSSHALAVTKDGLCTFTGTLSASNAHTVRVGWISLIRWKN